MTRLRTGGSGLLPSRGPDPGWEDKRLVRRCLAGDERAWSALVDKYKNMVYGVAVRYGAGSEDAADLFQSVWMDVCSELPRLRKQTSLRSWLISITLHKCYHWKREQARNSARRSHQADVESGIAVPPVAPEEVENQQLIRESIARLTPRCRELIRLLFFTQPPVPYREVARRLGLAIGSIGFIRGRCLRQLERLLVARGVA